ncbi:immunoglobulin domain-containing protein [Synoicihabitans lomoniglobus]|nr:immunoglobulin domain-containing protein [Opitutaceae bacterium LMO-M01]
MIPRPWLIPEPPSPPSTPRRSRRRSLLILAFLAAVTSLTAVPWINRPVPSYGSDPTHTMRGVVFNHGRFVAIANNRLHHSTDGLAWHPAPHADPSLRDLRVANGMFYHANGDRIYASPNGIFWQDIFTLPARTAPTNGVEQSTSAHDWWATDGSTALVARNRMIQIPGAIYGAVELFRSSDLRTWQPAAPLPGTGPRSSVSVQSMVGANGRCVINYRVSDLDNPTAYSRSIIACTTDNGSTWTRGTMEGEYESVRLLYGNGWFFGVTPTRNIYRSTNGISFVRYVNDLPTNFDPNIQFAGGLFVTRSIGESNTLYGSVEGLYWRDLGALPFPRVNALAGVAYGQGQFVAVGSAYLNAHQTMQPFFMTSVQAAPPVIRQNPASTRVAQSRRVRLSVTLEDSTQPVTYRWLKDGLVLFGETSATLSIDKIAMANTGSYRALITNDYGTVASEEAQITVIDPALGSRLTNLSVNAINGSGGEPINVGFVVHGDALKPVIVRGIGPTLAQFNVPDFLADPNLTLMRQGTVRGYNDNWGLFDGSDLGGFPLPPGSLDAVLPANLTPGPYSVVIDSPDHGVGRVLTEVYDNHLNDGENRLSNLSARAHLPAGGALVIGFVIEGNHPLPVILRGVGPALALHGVTHPLSNPRLTLFRSDGAPLATNDYWSDDDGRSLGAFPLPVGSPDAAIKITLAPGVYTAHLTSAIPANGSGTALIEVYDAM